MFDRGQKALLKRMANQFPCNRNYSKFTVGGWEVAEDSTYDLDVVPALVSYAGIDVDMIEWLTVKSELEASCLSSAVKREEVAASVKHEVEPSIKHESGERDGRVGESTGSQLEQQIERDKQVWRSLPHDMLVGLLGLRPRQTIADAARIANLERTNKTKQRQARKWQRKWGVVRKTHRKVRRDKKKVGAADEYHRGAGGKTNKAHLSIWGGVTAALMRAVSAASAMKIGVGLMTDISRWTIMRWERKAANALRVAKKNSRQTCDERLKQGDKENRRQYKINSIASDGTNANIFHKESLQVPLRH